MTTVAGLFEQRSSADRALEALERAGFERDAISVVARGDMHERQVGGSVVAEGAQVETGAFELGGVAIGGVLGLLAGLGALAIPGIGPILAVGTLGSALAGVVGGAAAGGLVGGLVGTLTASGLSEEHAQIYAEGVRRGGLLITVTAADEERADAAQAIMSRAGAVDLEGQRAAWQQQGWAGFDTNAGPFDTSAQQPGWLSAAAASMPASDIGQAGSSSAHPAGEAGAAGQGWSGSAAEPSTTGAGTQRAGASDHVTPLPANQERAHALTNIAESQHEISSHSNADGNYPNVGATGPGVVTGSGAQPADFPTKMGTGAGQVVGAEVPARAHQDDPTPTFNNANDTARTIHSDINVDGDYPTVGVVQGVQQDADDEQAIDRSFPPIVSGSGRPLTGGAVPNQDHPAGKPMEGLGERPRESDLGDEEGPAGSPTNRFRVD